MTLTPTQASDKSGYIQQGRKIYHLVALLLAMTIYPVCYQEMDVSHDWLLY